MRITALAIALIVLLSGFGIVAARQSENEAFQRVWERTDQPVEAGVVSRTWMWGNQVTGLQTEAYADAPGGERIVQYFDKSRMEESASSGLWRVTNGLLAAELITGQMQMGHSDFVNRGPALINVAGDADDPDGPTYASFRFHYYLQQPDDRSGDVVTEQIDRLGNITEDPALAAQGVQIASYDATTSHNIAAPFLEFMYSRGTVLEDGAYVEGPLVEHPVYATGLPVTEPYWADVSVDGTRQLVLMQCFERRCLTYTPGNEPGWQVETGNVGQHYHAWRYATSEAEGQLLFTGMIYSEELGRDLTNIFRIDADGSNLVNLSNNVLEGDDSPVWSPDGTRIAFMRYGPDTNIFVMDADGSNQTQLTDDGVSDNPVWSPDGTKIAYQRHGPNETQIFVMNADGSDKRQITFIPPVNGRSTSGSPAWSPDGTKIVFSNIDDTVDYAPFPSTVYVVNPDGTDLTPLVESTGNATPIWSPDGTRIAFQYQGGGGRDPVGTRLFVMDADGSNVVEIRLEGYYPGRNDHASPDWSPDGTRLVYSQSLGIFATDPDGTQQVQLAAFGSDPKWSPVGDHIAFGSWGGLVVITAGNTVPAVIFPEAAWQVSWRP